MQGKSTGADNGRNVVGGSNTDTTAVLDGFTITGGHTIIIGIDTFFGGAGMIIYSGNPTLIDFIFTGNSASQVGGGLFNSGGSPTLISCTFIDNKGGFGGEGMYNIDNSSPTLINCIFNNNMSNGHGAGMLNSDSSTMQTNCTFSENSADFGGGIYTFKCNTILNNCVFTKNRDSNSGRGCIITQAVRN